MERTLMSETNCNCSICNKPLWVDIHFSYEDNIEFYKNFKANLKKREEQERQKLEEYKRTVTCQDCRN